MMLTLLLYPKLQKILMIALLVHLLLLRCMSEGGGGRDKNRDSLVDIKGHNLVMKKCVPSHVQGGHLRFVTNSAVSQKATMRVLMLTQDMNVASVDLDGLRLLHLEAKTIVSSRGYCLTVLRQGGLQGLTLVPRPTTLGKRRKGNAARSESALKAEMILLRS